jgi:hypothetical protein
MDERNPLGVRNYTVAVTTMTATDETGSQPVGKFVGLKLSAFDMQVAVNSGNFPPEQLFYFNLFPEAARDLGRHLLQTARQAESG